MAEDRRLEVLRAIIGDFVTTREPVGSKMLVERYDLGVSPATVRNDMAALEDDGYLVQPHTSAGRIPTDKGYRLFVDRLTALRPLSRAERRAIHTFLEPAVDLDNVVERTVRLLSQLTHQVAMVQYPSLSRSRVRHVELVALGERRVLLVLIADTGRVEQRVVEVSQPCSEAMLTELRTRLNEQVVDQTFSELAGLSRGIPEQFAPGDRDLVRRVLDTLVEAAVESEEERVVVGGAANLARYGPDFAGTMHPVLEALEEHVVLLRLLGEATAAEQVSVTIGHENEVEQMGTTSVVRVGYGPGEAAIGHIGVVGPTRMDYPGNMSAVLAVARYLGRILADQ